jgi:hypothetical protein
MQQLYVKNAGGRAMVWIIRNDRTAKPAETLYDHYVPNPFCCPSWT